MKRSIIIGSLSVSAALFGACSGANDDPRVVTIGDNVSSNPTFRTSWVGLFDKNDDALFPAFQGKEMRALYGGDVHLVRLDKGGDSYHNLASADAPFCTCRGDECGGKMEPCLDGEATGPTIVIVELGGNDLLGMFLMFLNRPELRENPAPVMAQLRIDVREVLGLTQDRAMFPAAPEVFVMNAYDPSDGIGDLGAIAASILPPNFEIDVEAVSPMLALATMQGFNDIVRDEAAAIGATVIDTHSHFLGHGYHFDDMAHPMYRADDATQWIRGVFDPTLRGAHELRRLVWRALAKENIDEIPTNLPPESILGLPAVPDNGWAKVIAQANVTQELYSPMTDVTWPNESKDPALALGPPDLNRGSDGGAVALGVLGAFIVVDLGAETAAIDGEGDDFVVLEQGTQSAGTPEPYRVSVANAAAGPFVAIADARGEKSFDLGVAGVASARFVKVESLARAVDVLGGVGSPVAPGPEIDAIGAVHPGTAQ